ncbi:50S ribosomal protein L11 methyltransferase [Roseovarius sp. 2305UL8-3]|uniref:50S ribosomal protein L11 methyltransferase n=1 Tax=Roseovarius conchicola TaxID=3121636 RepID=UPI0035293440
MKKFDVISGDDLDAALNRQIAQQREWLSLDENGQFIDFMGRPFLVEQGVFPPGDDTIQLIESLPVLKGKNVLDFGCGTGAITIAAVIKGAASVVAVDINPAAVSNTIQNTDQWGFDDVVKVMECDGLPEFEEGVAFDLIVANLPGRNRTSTTYTEAAQWDTSFKAHTSLFEKSGEILTSDGRILIAKSNYPELNDVVELANANGYSCSVRNVDAPIPDDPRRSYILEFKAI